MPLRHNASDKAILNGKWSANPKRIAALRCAPFAMTGAKGNGRRNSLTI